MRMKLLAAALTALAAAAPAARAQHVYAWETLFGSGELTASDRGAPAAPYDLHRFEGAAGAQVKIEVAAEGFAPLVTVIRSSDGAEVAFGHGERQAVFEAPVKEDDIYLVAVASRDGAGLGRYRLRFTDLRAVAAAQAAQVSETAALNQKVNAQNQAVQARNDAAQAAYDQAQAKYRAERAAYEAQAAAADAARARYERDKADWEARVAACKAGDHAKCGS